MNSTLGVELERTTKAAEQQSDNALARLEEEVRQISAIARRKTREVLARYAVEPKSQADMDMQMIRFIKQYTEASQSVN